MNLDGEIFAGPLRSLEDDVEMGDDVRIWIELALDDVDDEEQADLGLIMT
jgi:hypothetical protein